MTMASTMQIEAHCTGPVRRTPHHRRCLCSASVSFGSSSVIPSTLQCRIEKKNFATRWGAAGGGASVWALLAELDATVKQVETSNDPAFGTTGAKLREALGSLERASKWLLERVTSKPNDALAGATPYLRLFGSTLGGCMLAGEALAAKANGDGERYVTLARFFAENVTVQAASLEKTVADSADAVNGADAVLLG